MKISPIKLAGIFIVAMIVVITGGLSIYFLIENNKTYYIYDVRIVEPVAKAGFYVYTDGKDVEYDKNYKPTGNYVSMKNKNVYMKNLNENKFEIAVYASTSISSTSVNITSSDTNVATISYLKGHCYVEYHRAGTAIITASFDDVKDSITVNVYDNIADYLAVFDETYYGIYNTSFENNVITYADDELYFYNYETSVFDDYKQVISDYEQRIKGYEELIAEYEPDLTETSELYKEYKKVLDEYDKILEKYNVICNDELLRVDPSSIDETIFSIARIDSTTKTLCLKCHSKDKDNNLIDKTRETSLVIQSFYYTSDGEMKIKNNYPIEVRIVADTPEYLQVLLSTTPDFEDGAVYVYTNKVDSDKIDITDKDLIKDVLSNQKELNYLTAENEFESYNCFFTNKISKIYIRLRKVYTNGEIVYLNPLTLEENPFELYVNGNDKPFDFVNNTDEFKISANQNYYVLTLTDYFLNQPNAKFTLTLTLGDYSLELKTFNFEYRDISSENVLDFYSYDEETGFYTYTYWDPRTRFNEVYNVDGKIIDFVFED